MPAAGGRAGPTTTRTAAPSTSASRAVRGRGDLAQDLAWARQARQRTDRAFDQLNPDYGVPADQRSRYGGQAVREREAALALGVRVAVHDSRQNDRDPVIWQPGQDYCMADALQRARAQPTRTRWGPERVGPER
jgi:hypothetical protein